MKSFLIPIVFLVITLPGYSQQFQQKSAAKLPAGTRPSQVLWVDADNDSLLDVVVADTSQHQFSATAYTGILKNTYVSKPLFTVSLIPGPMQLVDFNQDNKMDLAASAGTALDIWLNQGKFVFAQTPVTAVSVPAAGFSFSDLNNDARRDIVLTKDSASWQIYKNNRGVYEKIVDSTNMIVKGILVFDFDGNGFPDIALSGKNQLGEPILSIIEHKSNFDTLRVVHVAVTNSGIITAGDLNQDGFFDLIISGPTSAGQSLTQAFLNHDSLFTAGRIYTGVNPTNVLIADFDSDGLADVSLFGKDAGDGTVHQITTGSGNVLTIPSDKVLQMAFGDFDRDGDLDLIQLNDTLGLVLLENTVQPKNARPRPPGNMGVAIFYSHLFTYWDKATDDHTPSASITYDISVVSDKDIYYGSEFDQKVFSRLTVSNGNRGTNTFALMTAPKGDATVVVEAIDNSFFESRVGVGTAISCSIDFENVASCNNAPVILDAGSSSTKWFSFSGGFLGQFSTLDVKHPATDTVFSFIPSSSGCPKLTVYSILHSAKDTLHQTAHYAVCKEKSVQLTVDPQWQSVSWTKDKQPVGTGSPFVYTPENTGLVVGFAKNNHGCFLLQNDVVTISIPVLTVTSPEFAISVGQQVQLGVSGGGAYLWSPSEYLDDPTSPDPKSTPPASIVYIVTVTDSIGCQGSATVNVDVQQSAFIAELFTPNGKDDPRNEELKLYGLTQATDFHFTVVNREGAVVYETNDVASATGSGWNGTHNGLAQPTGIYYWRVEGVVAGGVPLRLNGKKQGSVILIR